jgi:poly(A) polymerase
MLRAVRFASRLGFEITPETVAAIQKHAGDIARISKERIQGELSRILLESQKAGDAILLLESTGLLEVILPDVAAMRRQDQPPQFHPEGDVLTHTVIMLNEMAYRDITLALAVLFHDLGKPPTAFHDGTRLRFNGHAERGAEMAHRIMRELHYPNRVIEDVTRCVGRHMHFMDVQKMRRSTLRRLIGSPTFEIEQELHRLDCIASHGMLDNHEFLINAQEEMANEPVLPPRRINGRDVIALGIEAGPQVGKWLKTAYDAQLNGEYSDRESLLRWLTDKIAEG